MLAWTRMRISKAKLKEKELLLKQYKILKNKFNGQIRKECKDFHNNRVDQGGPHFLCGGQKNCRKKLGGHKNVSKKLGGQK